MSKQTYVAKLGMYSRGFGGSPNWEETFEASDPEEAQATAKNLSNQSGPDTYVIDVKLKTD